MRAATVDRASNTSATAQSWLRDVFHERHPNGETPINTALPGPDLDARHLAEA